MRTRLRATKSAQAPFVELLRKAPGDTITVKSTDPAVAFEQEVTPMTGPHACHHIPHTSHTPGSLTRH